MATNNFPQQIFTTPDAWGGEFTYTADGLAETIDSLKALGDDWAAISVNDCTSYWLEEIVNGRGIYREENRRDNVYNVFEHGDHPDTFKLVKFGGSIDTIEWARELTAE